MLTACAMDFRGQRNANLGAYRSPLTDMRLVLKYCLYVESLHMCEKPFPIWDLLRRTLPIPLFRLAFHNVGSILDHDNSDGWTELGMSYEMIQSAAAETTIAVWTDGGPPAFIPDHQPFASSIDDHIPIVKPYKRKSDVLNDGGFGVASLSNKNSG